MVDPDAAQLSSPPASLAPVLGANRDGSATAESARSLLVTVMGEFVLPNDGAVWTQTLIALMELLGVHSKATRQALSRMEKQGWLHREKVGRRTRWVLTDSFAELLTEGARRIYDFGVQPRDWDGHWLVVHASVPERDRNVRYRMGLGLNWAGLGTLGHGLWIGPWTDRESAVAELLNGLGVEASSFRAELGILGTGPALVSSAWNLPELADQYHQFLAATADLPTDPVPHSNGSGLTPGAAAAAGLTDLVHQWRRFPFLDPDLPVDLLPADWPAPAAARRFAELRSSWLEPAHAWWRDLDDRYGP